MRRCTRFLVALLLISTWYRGGAGVEAAEAACEPDVLLLPALEGHESSAIFAMNHRGWAVGSSRASLSPYGGISYAKAVLWRDGAVFDLGLGGESLRRHKVRSVAIDVTEDGVIAAQRHRYENNVWVEASSWLWDNGELSRLPSGRSRPFAVVQSLNDKGEAAGYVSAYPEKGSARPALWRNGRQERLPMPAGAHGRATALNNHGLVIGWVKRDSRRHAWFWQVGGESGPLPNPFGYVHRVIDVDNHGRTVGRARIPGVGRMAVLWSQPDSAPHYFGNRSLAYAADMNDHGDLVGVRSRVLDDRVRAWVSRLGATHVNDLPSPRTSTRMRGTFGWAIIRGVTPFAPHGGLSVGGVSGTSGFSPFSGTATIWTCVQTY